MAIEQFPNPVVLRVVWLGDEVRVQRSRSCEGWGCGEMTVSIDLNTIDPQMGRKAGQIESFFALVKSLVWLLICIGGAR